MKANYSDPLFREAEIWAELDGCEGGDLLRALTYWAHQSQDGYGYAMSDKTEGLLRDAIRHEIAGHQGAVDDGSIYDYQEREFVADCLRRIVEARG